MKDTILWTCTIPKFPLNTEDRVSLVTWLKWVPLTNWLNLACNFRYWIRGYVKLCDDRSVMQEAGGCLCLHSVWSHQLCFSSHMSFFRMQCGFVLYRYINIDTPGFFFIFFLAFLFHLLLFPFWYLIFFNYYYFFRVPGCSGVFRNFPCSRFYWRPLSKPYH